MFIKLNCKNADEPKQYFNIYHIESFGNGWISVNDYITDVEETAEEIYAKIVKMKGITY